MLQSHWDSHFFEAGYVDEAIETLQAVIDEYQLKGDDKSKLMYYWQGCAFSKRETPTWPSSATARWRSGNLPTKMFRAASRNSATGGEARSGGNRERAAIVGRLMSD